jgi:hypothetical protein
MEERFQNITHKGESIVLLDLSNLQDDKEIIRLLRMRSTLHTSHGLLVDLTNTHFSRDIIKEAKENSKAIRPLIKAIAVVGTGSMVGVLVRTVSRFSGMNIATFDSRGAAMDWLSKEMGKR